MAYSAVCHPQCNGQAEAANKTIINGLKKRVKEKKNGWLDALYNVLWSLRTTKKEATCHTPFNLVFGSEALIPIEVTISSLRVKNWTPKENSEELRVSADLIDESGRRKN